MTSTLNWLKDEHDKQYPHIFVHPLSTWVKETDTIMKFENLTNDIHILMIIWGSNSTWVFIEIKF